MKIAISHDDFPAVLALRRADGQPGFLRSYYLPRFRHAGVELVVGAVFVHPSTPLGAALQNALEQIAAVWAEVAESGGAFAIVTTAAELEQAQQQGRIALVLSMEGAEPLGSNADLLPVFHRLGVRLLGPTWNGRNAFGDGCALSGGLTAAGRQLVRAAWELGMAVDVSHLSDAGFSEVLALGDGPVLASHSNSRVLCPHPRNLTDTQLEALGRRGSVVGINQVAFLARTAHAGDVMGHLCAHLRHMQALLGTQHICLGLDFAREYNTAFHRSRDWWLRWDPSREDLLDSWGDLPVLAQYLTENGFSIVEIQQIFHENLWKYLHCHLP